MSNDKDTEREEVISEGYHMKGLAKLGNSLLTAFLVWCTFNYPMSDTMQAWFYVWAVTTWLIS